MFVNVEEKGQWLWWKAVTSPRFSMEPIKLTDGLSIRHYHGSNFATFGLTNRTPNRARESPECSCTIAGQV
jgi:hypothetical protein